MVLDTYLRIKKNLSCKLLPGTISVLDKNCSKNIEKYLQDKSLKGYEVQIIREAVIDNIFLDCVSDSLGWKHSIPGLDVIKKSAKSNQTLFITITKNPYSFLLSLHQCPHHRFLLRKNQEFIIF